MCVPVGSFAQYLRTPADRQDWRFAPLVHPDLRQLAPAWIAVAEYDPLRDEGQLYRERLRDAGVDADCRVFKGMVHSFMQFGGLVAAAYTDFLQGLLIIVLSVLLIPAGLELVGGAAGLHETLGAARFSITAPAGSDEGDLWFVVAMSVLGLTGIVAQGPTYKAMEVQGNKVVLKFETYGAPLGLYYGEPLTGFAIAGEDKKWVWGEAKIVSEDTIEVTGAEIAAPVAVRYNWANNPQGNLYNAMYLPAYPFRTDDWPGVTADKVHVR